MRRFLAGVALGAIIAVPAGFGAGALKDATFGTVTANDIEQGAGGGGNLGNIAFHGNASTDALVSAGDDYLGLFYRPGYGINISTGTTDPTVTPCKGARPGSLYLRHADEQTGEMWFKTTNEADPCGWVKVAS